jgi:hypothetical protein
VQDWEIRPRAGVPRIRRPLRHRELYLDFANCKDRTAIAKFVNAWGLLDFRPMHLVSGYLSEANRFRALLLMVSEMGCAALPMLTWHPEVFNSGLPGAATILQPTDLRNAMLAQMHQDLGGTSLLPRSCNNCGRLLLIGPGHRRPDVQYCGHTCVVAAGRRRRRRAGAGGGSYAIAGRSGTTTAAGALPAQ